jgi:hypothetical protein
LEHEIRASAGMGTAHERARLHFGRAIAFLERGMLREALDEANATAYLDPDLRPGALIVARMCVRKELAPVR